MPERLLTTILGLLFCLSCANVRADIAINTTRIIYAKQHAEENVRLSNQGKKPLLVQAWIDTGDARSDPDTADVPFTISPPVARIDPGKGQILRVFKIRDDLPKDRESLFWFNLLEIPPIPDKSVTEGKNTLQMSFRTRIKLFYRPTALLVTPEQSYESLSFAVKKKPATYVVEVNNPSPYYVTFNKLELLLPDGSRVVSKMGNLNSRFVAPYGALSMPLPELKSAPLPATKVRYTLINDSGGVSRHEQALAH